MKKSFVLLSTILLVVVFSFLSLRMVETNLLSSNLNTHKYLHFEAIKHRDTIITYIKEHENDDIESYTNSLSLVDNRFEIELRKDEEENSVYYLSIKTVDDSHIRLSQKIIK
ncbi:MAG: hypothetical protein WA945_07240 [Arcobacteraceae bacterium]